MTGRVIFLFGTSSSGKTETTAALRDLLDEPFLEFGLDVVFGMVPPRWGSAGGAAAGGFWYEELPSEPPTAVIRYGPVGARVLAGMRATVQALAAAGNNVVVDEMPIDEAVLEAWRHSLQDVDALWVRLLAGRDVLERNERGRATTHIGLALGHAAIVDAADWADLTLDSGCLEPHERALAIVEAAARWRS